MVTTTANTTDFRTLDQATKDRLRGMVAPDPYRPGAERDRLLTENLPIWAIIGDLIAHSHADDAGTSSARFPPEAIGVIAHNYDISSEAIRAAILYYIEHQAAIDTWLAANEAARVS